MLLKLFGRLRSNNTCSKFSKKLYSSENLIDKGIGYLDFEDPKEAEEFINLKLEFQRVSEALEKKGITGHTPSSINHMPNDQTGEVGGPTGPEPTRYGDWERKGRVSDF